MHPLRFAAVTVGLGLFVCAGSASAQEWSPPSRQMPAMLSSDALGGSWRASAAGWFLPGTPVAEVRAAGQGGGTPRFVRFTAGARPVAAWSDRNGDGRCDMLEIYRGGSVAYQLIDADYDGTANVLRVYDDSGSLQREQRL